MDPDRGSIIESLYKIACMSKLSVSYLLNFLITQLQSDVEASKSVSPNLGTRTVRVHFLIRTWEVSVSMFCSFVKWWNNKYCLCQLVHDFNMLKHVVFYWTTYWCYISFFIILLSFINIHKLILDRNRLSVKWDAWRIMRLPELLSYWRLCVGFFCNSGLVSYRSNEICGR